ncbi:hypothetical protein EJ02DRAFT_450107 [Clathrospora elynae]|uniref:Uncharacterized protein n=1 Tax=Clathrospora elynae TaxID=706981 RepID=A0A6A5T4Y1_9PLEO|nr:hypothetical protein EJ02DRAFT_450107 [Clathrospora elynae]
MVVHDDRKEGDLKYACVSVTATDDSPPETARAKTWGNDSGNDEIKRRDWRSRARWKTRWHWSLQEAWIRVYHIVKRGGFCGYNAATRTAKLLIDFPVSKYSHKLKKQLFAFVLVIAFAFVPIVVLGYITHTNPYELGNTTFYRVFEDKVLTCGDNIYGTSQNATVTGFEKLFSLDSTFGRFSFSQVKTIDILWDLLVGRGVQILAWWVAYTVFSDALLRAIERHPASFSIFQRIALEGPSLYSLWTLTRELWVAKSRRTKALFFYMLWSTAYVLCVPIVLGAMTGYDSTAIAWIDLGDTNNIVPASMVKPSWLILGTKNQTWTQSVCQDYGLQYEFLSISSGRINHCDCQLPNGTMIPEEVQSIQSPDYPYDFPYINCIYNYQGNTQTYEDRDYWTGTPKIFKCNTTIAVDINGTSYDAQDLNTNTGYCYDSVAYDENHLFGNSRCLPDTADPSYRWGFSTLMFALFIFFTAGWVVTMYAVWQEAQFNSTLVKAGYKMTPLRAAFAMAKVAKKRTGMGEKQLVRANTKDLETELFGGKGKKRTKIEYGIFADDPEDGDEDMQVQAISDEVLEARHRKGVAEAAASSGSDVTRKGAHEREMTTSSQSIA